MLFPGILSAGGKDTVKGNFLYSALLVVIVMTGCTSFSTTAQRDATIVSYRDVKIDGVPIETFLLHRTEQIIAGAEFAFDSAIHSGDSKTFEFHALGNKTWHSGKAVAIDSRGYFLTAAHIVRDGAPTVFYGNGPSFDHFPARIVWLGYNEPGQLDLALIHIDVSVPSIFVWSQNNQVGDSVLAFGPNLTSTKWNWTGYTKNFSDGLIAGKLLTVPTYDITPAKTVIYTDDLPVHPGDSGGPLIDTQGRLIGINITVTTYRVLGRPYKFIGEAIRPDPVWLKQLIEEDYIAHKSK